MNIDAVVEQIISVESNGDPNAKNKRSSAMGLGQFLDETWLGLILELIGLIWLRGAAKAICSNCGVTPALRASSPRDLPSVTPMF